MAARLISAALLACVAGWISAAEVAQEISVGVDQRRALSVVVYDTDLGLVTDTREGVLPSGLLELQFPGIAAKLHAGSASLEADKLSVVEQNFRYDLLGKSSILSRFLGRKLKYSRSVSAGGRYEKVLREGILLSADPEIVQFGDEIEIGPEGTISLAYLPKELKATPTLLWLATNEKTESRVLTARYLSRGLSWNADYELVLGRRDAAELTGWANVTNDSGADYLDARLTLVAGDVAAPLMPTPRAPQPQFMMERAAADMAAPRSVGRDLYAFKVPHATSLLRKEAKHLRLFPARTVNLERRLVARGFVQMGARESRNPVNVMVAYAFENAHRALPRGTVSVYREGEDARMFIGSAQIDRVPVGEEVVVETGQAFNVQVVRTQVGHRMDRGQAFEAEVTLTVQNRGERRERVTLEERIPGSWELLRESKKSRREPGRGLSYVVTVPAGESVEVGYAVVMRP